MSRKRNGISSKGVIQLLQRDLKRMQLPGCGKSTVLFPRRTTTDDHGMHLVGYLEKDGKDWYLIKDSGSGSKNNDPNAKEWGYYFFSEDYVKLKMMDFMVHKDAVKDLQGKF